MVLAHKPLAPFIDNDFFVEVIGGLHRESGVASLPRQIDFKLNKSTRISEIPVIHVLVCGVRNIFMFELVNRQNWTTCVCVMCACVCVPGESVCKSESAG